MSFPQIIDYNEAVQDPRNAFADPELKAGKVVETPLGLPLALSGGFALTYVVNSGPRKFAVRCFHREVPEAQKRYAAVSAKLRSLGSPYFVNFDFQARGIVVRGKPYPIVKMDWVEGETLGTHLDRIASNAGALVTLQSAFADLASFLERNGIAHGDIQNENVIVSNGALRLIDYDGMFVTGMQEGSGSEVGHKHFQHPERAARHFGPRMDRFSSIVLDVSLEALRGDPSLHPRFREGGQAILFKANDFANPGSSEIFRIIGQMNAVREKATKLAAVCQAPISSVPTLTDFVAGRNIPITVKAPGTTSKPPVPQAYIGAFEVVDAKDFNAVMRLVGDKVELIGEIVSVKVGTGKRGRGKGRPFVFINFGIWNKDSVKVTIWSEGLGKMSTRPSEAWVGCWISATGLIEPPYEGNHYGRPYRNVGITVGSDNEIMQLTEREAKFRLRPSVRPEAGRASEPAATTTPVSKNHDILKGLSPAPSTGSNAPPPRRPITSSSAPTAAVSRKSKNEDIIERLRNQGTSSTAPPSAPPLTTSSPSTQPSYHHPSSPSLFERIPGWLWIAGIVLALVLLGSGCSAQSAELWVIDGVPNHLVLPRH